VILISDHFENSDFWFWFEFILLVTFSNTVHRFLSQPDWKQFSWGWVRRWRVECQWSTDLDHPASLSRMTWFFRSKSSMSSGYRRNCELVTTSAALIIHLYAAHPTITAHSNVLLSLDILPEEVLLLRLSWVPLAGSGVERKDPLRFLAGCKRRLNQALSVFSPILVFFLSVSIVLLTRCQGQSFLASLWPKFWNGCFHYLMTWPRYYVVRWRGNFVMIYFELIGRGKKAGVRLGSSLAKGYIGWPYYYEGGWIVLKVSTLLFEQWLWALGSVFWLR